MEAKEYQKNVMYPIMLGEYDEFLDSMIEAIRLRKKDMAPKVWEFQIGDTIRMVNTTPKYLNGASGRVRKVNRTKIVIDLDEPHGRFHRNIVAPLSMIEKVN